MKKEKSFYVYKITNLITEKLYIGKTSNISARWLRHLSTARTKYKRSYSYIHRSMNKYGFENFIIEMIAGCKNEEEAFKIETNCIKLYNSKNNQFGYNLTDGGDGCSGRKDSQETINKRSNSLSITLGDGRYLGEKAPFYGKKHSIESKNKMSKAHLGKTLSEKVVKQISARMSGQQNPMLGKTHTEEAKAKIAESTRKRLTKFSSKECEEIRAQYIPKKVSFQDIANKYSVSKSVIQKVIRFLGPYKK